MVADEAREPEEIEDPPDAETSQGDPEKELGAGTSEIEVMEAEKEPEDKSKHQRFLATAEFSAVGFYCLRIEGAEGCFDRFWEAHNGCILEVEKSRLLLLRVVVRVVGGWSLGGGLVWLDLGFGF